METWLQDIRYAWRHIRRSPGFALTAIVTLALGIGATTTVFSLVNAVAFTHLPIQDPDQLFAIRPKTARGQERSTPVSAVDLLRDGPLQPLCGYLGGTVLPVLANNAPVETLTTFVTAHCFDAFGITPTLGRGITESEAPVNGKGAPVALISHRLWTRSFDSDPGVLGRTLQVNNVNVTIIGVLPREFVGLEVDYGVDVFTTFDSVLAAGPIRRQLASYLIGRLRPGVTLDQASAELQTRWPALLDAVVPPTLAATEREQLRDATPRLERIGRGNSSLRERYLQPLTLVLLLTSLLLLLACVNLGGVLLARVSARRSELSVRLALGGTRWRVARQMIIESVVLSLVGAAAAVPLAYVAATALPTFMPPTNVPYTMSFAPDARVLTIAVLIGIASGILMSVIPVVLATGQRTTSHLAWDRTIVGSTSRWSRVLLVAQVAMSVVLVAAATLLARSLFLLQESDLGVRTSGVVDVKLMTLPNAPYNRGQRVAYYPPLLERIAALPGVQAVSLSDRFPRVTATRRGSPTTFTGDPQQGVESTGDYVSPQFFEMMGIRLLSGRNVSWADTLQTRSVAVVSESLARALAPNGNVLERAITIRSLPVDQQMVIVGVVSDASQGDLRNTHPLVAYRPALQVPAISAFNPNLLIATTDPATVASGVRQILREAGQDYAQEIIGLPDLLARAPSSERMTASVAMAVGVIAVLLAIIGVHGALAYAVSRRRREIGVRVAIGATPSSVGFAIVREGLVLTGVGVAIGLPLAYLGARSLKALMYGIVESDITTFAIVAIFLLIVGAAAGLMPARRAARLDPVTALRSE